MSRSSEKRDGHRGVISGNPYYPARPELVIGFAAPVGTPLDVIMRRFREHLETRKYKVHTLHLSDYLDALNLPGAPTMPSSPTEYQRISILMRRGNDLRKFTGRNEILALMAAADVHALRPTDGHPAMTGRAILLRQLKHPDEVVWLRYIYGSSFLLVGVHWPEKQRERHLVERGMDESEAWDLIDRDRGEDVSHGQQLQKTFHMADVFLAYPFRETDERGYENELDDQVRRIIRLVFGEEIITPSRDEFGMYLAWAASLRSADLSRQVGACILSEAGDVLALGCNEVPAPGGGQYWPEDPHDQRDFKRGADPNQEEVSRVLDGLVAACLEAAGDAAPAIDEAALRKALARTDISDLTEFGRAVHAEMAAILAAGRLGLSLVKATLYTTTFPCHNCAKHIICSGIRRIVYVEPYPKSRADRLHHDALDLAGVPGDDRDHHRVAVEPFIGVAPRLYPVVFATTTPEGKRISRKDTTTGAVLQAFGGPRLGAPPLSYVDRERVAASTARELIDNLKLGG